MLSVRQACLSISFLAGLVQRFDWCLFGVFKLRQTDQSLIIRKKIANSFFL